MRENQTQPDLYQEEFSMARKIKNAFRNAFTNPYNLIVIVAIVALTYLIVVPLIEMITVTFQATQQDLRRIPGAQVGDFTLFYWNRLLFSDVSSSLLYKPLMNSLGIAICVSVLSIAIGSATAWLMVRSDMPGKKFFSLAIIIPYMLPSWCKSMAWLTVFKTERIGGSPGFLSALGVQVPEWLAYGPLPIILVLTLHYYAYAYLLVSASLSSINSELEEMGEIAGANKLQILRRITLPLVLPAILSSFILTFSKSIGTFGVPAFLGMKANFFTISTRMYSSIRQQQTTTGYAIATILILISSLNVYINQRAIGARKSYATIGGKGGRSTLISLGKWRVLIVVLLVLFIFVGVMGPLIILTVDTFMLKPGVYSLDNFSLHYWSGAGNPDIYEGEPGVFANSRFWQIAGNTLKLVLITSIVATVCGQIIGYIASRGRGKFSGKLVEQMVFIPYLIPSIAFGAIYLSMFSKPQLLIPSLYGTFTLMVLVSVVKHLPFSSRSGTSNMMQIGIELEEAGSIEGASFLQRFGRIVLPLSKNGFISGLMLIFISIMKELDLIILIVTPSMNTLPYMAFTYSNSNMAPYSNVVAVIMFVIVLFFYWLTNKVSKTDISKSLGG
ncbi:iron ABC transporter permease [Eubacteriales bacterium OttesenSCG-928-K08]|nr:iron ABC transporter permease [Eubacteriales bacterium OttesenSCG-928-K08]